MAVPPTVRASLAVVVLTVVAGAAGCGGQSAAERWRIKADNACLEARTAIARLGPIQGFDGIRDVARDTRPVAQRAIARLRALDPPGDLRGASAATIAALERELPLVDQVARAAGRRDRSAILRLAGEGRSRERTVAAAAHRAGLKQCGSQGQTPGG
jgi:hypothetical protein